MSILENRKVLGAFLQTCTFRTTKLCQAIWKVQKLLQTFKDLSKRLVPVSGLLLSLKDILNRRSKTGYTAWLELSPLVYGWFLIESIYAEG